MTSKKYQLTKGASKTPIYPISYVENIKINETENLNEKLTSIDTEIAALKDAPGGGGSADLTNYYNKQETDTLISGTYESGILENAVVQNKEIPGISGIAGFRGGVVVKIGQKAFIVGAIKELTRNGSKEYQKCIMAYDLSKKQWLDEYYSEMPVDKNANYTTSAWYNSTTGTIYYTSKPGNSDDDLIPSYGNAYSLYKYAVEGDREIVPVWNHVYNPDEQDDMRYALNGSINALYNGFIYSIMPSNLYGGGCVYKIDAKNVTSPDIKVCEKTAVPNNMRYTIGGHVVIGNKVYFCARDVDRRDPYILYAFNFTTGTYETLSTLPTGFGCMTSIVSKSSTTLMVAHQDVDPSNPEFVANNDIILEFDISSKTWTRLEARNKFTDKVGSVGIYYEKAYYLFGGNANSSDAGEIVSFGDRTLTDAVSSKPSKTILQAESDMVSNYLGKDGELVYDKSSKSLRIMDGKKRGGSIALDAYTKNEADSILENEFKLAAYGGELVKSNENALVGGGHDNLYHSTGEGTFTVLIGDILYLVGAISPSYSPNSPFSQSGLLIRAINLKTNEWVKECKCDLDYSGFTVAGAWTTDDNAKIQFIMRMSYGGSYFNTSNLTVCEYDIKTNKNTIILNNVDRDVPATYINAIDGLVVEYNGYLYNIVPSGGANGNIYRIPKGSLAPGNDELVCDRTSFSSIGSIGANRVCSRPAIYGNKAYWHTGGYNEYDDIFKIVCYDFTTNKMSLVCDTCQHINTTMGITLIDENTIMIPGQYYDLNEHCDGVDYTELPRKNILLFDIPTKKWSMHEAGSTMKCAVMSTLFYNNNYYFIGGNENSDNVMEIMTPGGSIVSSKQPKTLLKGTSSDLSKYIGEEGQLVYDKTEKVVKIMDGKTPGGISLAGGGSSPSGNSYTKEEVDKIVADAVAAAILQMTNKITTDITALETDLVDKYVGADEIMAVAESAAEETES